MSTTSLAVLTKARAKFGVRLKERDYQNLLNCQSVPEIMVYLKSHTHFAKALADVDERNVHRGRLEMLLRQNLFYEFDALCRYDSDVSDGFSRYVLEKTEVEQILRFLILLSANATEKFILQFPAFFSKHTEIDVNRLAGATDYASFLEALAPTPYYRLLKDFQPNAEGRPPVAEIEMKLYGYIYQNLLTLVLKKTKGQERDELETLFYTINDYTIFSRILRLKKYYELEPEKIKESLFLRYTHLSPALIDRMCRAETTAEVFDIMQSAGTGRMIGKIGYSYAGDIPPRVKYRLAKKNIRFSVNPSVVMISFMFTAETELMNVISLIEGIRYQVDRKTIRSLLIM